MNWQISSINDQHLISPYSLQCQYIVNHKGNEYEENFQLSYIAYWCTFISTDQHVISPDKNNNTLLGRTVMRRQIIISYVLLFWCT